MGPQGKAAKEQWGHEERQRLACSSTARTCSTTAKGISLWQNGSRSARKRQCFLSLTSSGSNSAAAVVSGPLSTWVAG